MSYGCGRDTGASFNGAIALTRLTDTNRLLWNTQEEVGQAEEALKVFERVEEKCWQGHCLKISLGGMFKPVLSLVAI